MGLIIILIVLVLGYQAKAQDEFSPSGNFTIDLNFNPAAIFDANAGSMFSMPYIKGRYFISSKTVLRLGFLAEFDSETEYLDVDGNDYTRTASNYFVLSPGIERQFGSKRFFFYFGGEIPFSTYTTRQKTEINGTTVEVKNPDGGYFSLGVNLILGCDFYIFPNLYIGAEFAPGYGLYKYYDESVDGTVTTKGGSGTSIELSSSSGIRIGVRF